MAYPVNTDHAWLIEPFGTTKGRSFPHSGDDWTPKVKGDVSWLAVQDGEIVKSARDAGAGNWAVVDSGDIAWVYGHGKYAASPARTYLRAGDAFGTIGATGNTTGPHLHISAYTSVDAAKKRSVAKWVKGMTVDEWANASKLVRPSTLYRDKVTAPVADKPSTILESLEDNMRPIFHSGYMVTWPNGFTNVYAREVYDGLLTYFANYDYKTMTPHPGTIWATQTVIRESWAAVNYLQAADANATVDKLLKSLPADLTPTA